MSDLQPIVEPGRESPRHETVLIAEEPAMTPDEFEAAFTAMRESARSYNDRLASQRANALRLFNGEPFGDEENGRSAIVLTEVQDTIAAVMPTIIRVFAGAEHPIEFTPTKPGDDEAARQATDYVRHIVFSQCNGFRAIHDAALDACQLKVGWLRWWWDDSIRPVAESYSGLLHPQCAALVNQEGVRALKVTRRKASEEEIAALTQSPESAMVQTMPGADLLLYDVEIVRKVKQARPRIEAVPSESVWIDPDASGPEDARGIFIVTETTIGELVALGFDQDELERCASDDAAARNDKVKRRRDRAAGSVTRDSGEGPTRRITYTEGWIRVDYDGDGIAELRRVQAVGQHGGKILAHHPAASVPLARLVPFAVAHKAIGQSYADRVGDLQIVGSRVLRNVLDSLTASIHPRTVIKDGSVPLDDVLNTEMGAVVREREVGAVRELVKPFIGPAALPLMDVLAAIRESRTGITRGSQGLTAEALQSTAPIAVSAQISAAQDRLELTLRWIAEGLRAMYAGVLALMATHQDRTAMVRLRGKWTPVDPRGWVNAFTVQTEVAIGRGSLAERLQVLGATAAKQEQILSTYGPQNPLVTVAQYRATLADMLNTAGIANVGRYFLDPPADWAPEPTPPQPSPDQLLAQVEMIKSGNDSAKATEKNRSDMLGKLLEDDRLRDEARAKAMLQAAELHARYGVELDLRTLSVILERDPEVSLAAGKMVAPPQPNEPLGGAPPEAAPAPTPNESLGGDVVPGAGPPVGGPVGAASVAPPRPGARQPSLGDARAFLPPQLIQALASMRRAEGAGPPGAPGPG